MARRKKTKKIHVGNVPVGGGSPVTVQSMTKTDTRDVRSTVRQIRALARAGCEIIRVAVPDRQAAEALGRIKPASPIPVIADIHFDWRLALEAVRQGVDGLRLNPGNIGARWKVAEVVAAAAGENVPIRVGVNAGSIDNKLLRKYGHPCAEALVESAADHISILESLNFHNIKVSVKASGVPTSVDAYRLFSKRFRYPLHVGISEAGPPFTGIIKSSAGLAILLSEGIGDTVRVSLSAGPAEEVRVAYEILKALNLREKGARIVSCPTCGRCQIDIRGLASKVEGRLRGFQKPVTVAVMGCVVNGPGEAREADIGIAGGKGSGLLFKKGRVVRTVREEELFDTLMEEIGVWSADWKAC
ncbi:MAG: flavodoxin-dependent (E)-4-hydroxy-3-methylbut-2-enyl-diphosphate synthase [Candidatus Sulfobium sp.]|jgi:(E)-4-hydroxy-3-methylbut-2-enyl-diphosphate synthase